MATVAVLEIGHDGANFLDVLEDAAVDGLLFERPVEAFSDTVGAQQADHVVRGMLSSLDSQTLDAMTTAQEFQRSGLSAEGSIVGVRLNQNKQPLKLS